MPARGLGRREPPDFEHVEKYPLTATTIPSPPTSGVLGINWYDNFDTPIKLSDGRWWIGRNPDGSVKKNLGTVRGGHAIAIRPESVNDTVLWYRFYNQGSTGECVGFSTSRAMSLRNRRRYDAEWLYCEAFKLATGKTTCDPNSGTLVRAAFDILKTKGHRIVYGPTNTEYGPSVAEGITVYRWATSVDDIYSILGAEGRASSFAKVHGVPLLNSWGTDYPNTVWMPEEILDRLVFHEGGEAGVPTDR